MAFKHTVVWKKTEPTAFGSAEDAYQDKNRLYTPEITAAIAAWHAAMINNGIMLQPLELAWNQADQTLSVIRTISNIDDYRESRTYDIDLLKQLAADAGWEDFGASMVIAL